MSTVFSEPINLGDLVKYEEPTQAYSRDIVMMAPNQVLALGTVVAMVSATKMMTALAPTATDGSQNACGILLHDVDTTSPGSDEAIVLSRESVVSGAYVVWPAGITTQEKELATAQLKALGILIRQGA